MDPLSVTASIVALLQLSSKVLGYLNDVKDASKDRAKCAIEAANLYSLLTTLRFRLEDGSSDQPWHASVRALGVENGPLDQFKQALEQLQVKMTQVRKLGSLSDALVWKFSKEEIAGILSRMERLKTLVHIALEMDHFKLSQAIQESTAALKMRTEAIQHDTSFLRASFPLMESKVDVVRQANERVHFDSLMAWISPTGFPAQQADVIVHRQEGTGQWFLDAPEFTNWLDKPNGTLFCPGIPGAGKTMIAAIAIDHLLRSLRCDSVGVAYVYCNYKAQGPGKRNTTYLLAALLKQLVQARPGFMGPVQTLHDQYSDIRTKPSAEEVFLAFRSTLAKFTTVYVVVDGLDEFSDNSGDRGQLLAQLRDLQALSDLRLMITSRSIPDVMEELSKASKLEIQASDEDVRRFIAGQICRLPKCIQGDATLRDLVEDKIVASVDRMFLLARLHVDSLLDKRTKSKIKLTLETFSAGSRAQEKPALGQAYDDAMARIKAQLPEDAALAIRVLSWVTYARRPLTISEVCSALALEPEDKEFDSENVLDIADMVSVCAGLVVIDKESSVVRLVHYTTYEYLKRTPEWILSAELDISLICLRYLSLKPFEDGACLSSTDFRRRVAQNPFLLYAARYWGRHALAVQGDVHDLACAFLRHDGFRACATQAAVFGIRKSSVDYAYPQEHRALHIAAYFGLDKVLATLLSSIGKEGEISVNSTDNNGRTALAVAVYGGERVVKLLLDQGANIYDSSHGHISPLHEASYHGYEQIVRLFLERGVDVHVEHKRFGTPLQAASWGGHEQVMKLLLDAGASVNSIAGFHGNPLQAAAFECHERAVRLLLDRGANVNAQGGYNGNALQAALTLGTLDQHLNSNGDRERAVRLLLDKGADVNAQGGYYFNALQAASLHGRSQAVRLLLENGADANTVGGPNGSFLNTLALGGCTDLLQLAIEKYNADPKLRDFYGRTPLHFSARGGYINTFNFLISLGLDPANRDEAGSGVLHYASSGSSMELLESITSRGLIPSAKDALWTPLHWACRIGIRRVVERLIEAGIMATRVATAQPNMNWSPLSIALLHGNVAMVDQLSATSVAHLDLGHGGIEGSGDFALWLGRPTHYVCDGCELTIHGPRFHCRTCPDHDLCLMCKPALEHLHPGHPWGYIV